MSDRAVLSALERLLALRRWRRGHRGAVVVPAFVLLLAAFDAVAVSWSRGWLLPLGAVMTALTGGMACTGPAEARTLPIASWRLYGWLHQRRCVRALVTGTMAAGAYAHGPAAPRAMVSVASAWLVVAAWPWLRHRVARLGLPGAFVVVLIVLGLVVGAQRGVLPGTGPLPFVVSRTARAGAAVLLLSAAAVLVLSAVAAGRGWRRESLDFAEPDAPIAFDAVPADEAAESVLRPWRGGLRELLLHAVAWPSGTRVLAGVLLAFVAVVAAWNAWMSPVNQPLVSVAVLLFVTLLVQGAPARPEDLVRPWTWRRTILADAAVLGLRCALVVTLAMAGLAAIGFRMSLAPAAMLLLLAPATGPISAAGRWLNAFEPRWLSRTFAVAAIGAGLGCLVAVLLVLKAVPWASPALAVGMGWAAATLALGAALLHGRPRARR